MSAQLDIDDFAELLRRVRAGEPAFAAARVHPRGLEKVVEALGIKRGETLPIRVAGDNDLPESQVVLVFEMPVVDANGFVLKGKASPPPPDGDAA